MYSVQTVNINLAIFFVSARSTQKGCQGSNPGPPCCEATVGPVVFREGSVYLKEGKYHSGYNSMHSAVKAVKCARTKEQLHKKKLQHFYVYLCTDFNLV